MKAPSPIWEVVYKNDRRKHRHRCRCCSKIIEPGMSVLMVRLARGAWAVHIECADKFHGTAEQEWTWRDAFEAWGIKHLRACGFYNISEHPMSCNSGLPKSAILAKLPKPEAAK